MAELLIPEETTKIEDLIYKDYEENRSNFFRPHLGGSLIGGPCDRAIWLSFRWTQVSSFPGRILRLFDHGNIEEGRITRDLISIGAKVISVDPQTGKQFRFNLFGGHLAGSVDGIGKNFFMAPKTWHLLEYKTHNERSFKDLLKKGVQKSKPEHFDQMQCYMGMSGEFLSPPLHRAIYIAVNKNTDDIYSERIKFSQEHYDRIVKKASFIIFTPTPPARITEDPDFYRCKWCDYRNVCQQANVAKGEGREITLDEAALPETNCRTCAMSTPKDDGTWFCEQHEKEITMREQEAGCTDHLFVPDLLPWPQEDVDPEQGTISYRGANDKKIINLGGGVLNDE